MGKMTLDEAKKSPKLDEGAKGTKKGRQFGGPADSAGSMSHAGPDWGKHQSECQKGEGEGRHDEQQQEASLAAQSQTTGRGSTAG